MLKNTKKFGDIIYSQKVHLKLIEKGYQNAYETVQKAALDAINNDESFKDNIISLDLLTDEEITQCFNKNDYLKNIEIIFSRF